MQDGYVVYCAENLVNGKLYVGISKNLRKRKQGHKTPCKEDQWAFQRAIKAYGWNNFTWHEIETHTRLADALDAERFFIAYLNTLAPNGYNLVPGGEMPPVSIGEKHPRAKLTEKLVLEIREKWANGMRIPVLAREYSIGETTLYHIVHGETWRHLPTTERRSLLPPTIPKRPHMVGKSFVKLTDDEVMSIRERWANGAPIKLLAREAGLSYNTISHIVKGKTWPHLPIIQSRLTDSERRKVYLPKGENHPRSPFTKQDGARILEDYSSGAFTLATLARKYGVHPKTISRIVKGKSWIGK